MTIYINGFEVIVRDDFFVLKTPQINCHRCGQLWCYKDNLAPIDDLIRGELLIHIKDNMYQTMCWSTSSCKELDRLIPYAD